MSRISTVIKNKNRIEKEYRKKRNDDISSIRADAMYRNKLNEELKYIKLILEDEEVKSIIITIDERLVSHFLKVMSGEELAEYTILQEDNTHFRIGRKVINF